MQVLRFWYDKRQSRLYRYSRSLKSTEHEKHIDRYNCELFGNKRKRCSTGAPQKSSPEQIEPLSSSKKKVNITPGIDSQNKEFVFDFPDADENHLSDSRDHENGRNIAFLSCAFPKRNTVRAKRFFWTDRLDRYDFLIPF